jgi:spore germination protein KC
VRLNTSVFNRAFCLMLLTVGLFLTACGDKTEISDLTIVVGFGIDQEGKNVRVTAQVRKTAEGAQATGATGQQAGPGRQYTNLTASGRTVEEAVQNLRKITPRRLYFPHNTVVVFGRQFAGNGIDPALDFLLRSREFRRTQLFCVTSGTARDLLNTTVGAEQVSALGLQRLLLPEDIEFLVAKTTEMVFLNELLSPSHVPIMTWVDVERGQAILKGTGLFRGDKLAELLPAQLAQSLFLLRGEMKTFTVELPCQQPNQKSMYRLRFIRRELNPVRKGGDMSFHVRIRGKGEPVTMCHGNYMEPETINKMEKDVNSEMQQRLRKTVDYLQQRGLDGAMLGSSVYRVDPQWWRSHAREWPQLFARMPVKIDVQVDVTRPGMFTTPPEIHYTPELYPPKSAPGGDRP